MADVGMNVDCTAEYFGVSGPDAQWLFGLEPPKLSLKI